MNLILFTIWIFLPAGLANAMATTSRLFPYTQWLAFPVDMKKNIGGIRIFGDNKTFRGLFFGVLFGTILAVIQKEVYLNSDFLKDLFNISEFTDHGYSGFNIILFGFLISFGALFGDMIKSFFKRRAGVKPGGSFFPFDQIDYILGSIIFSLIAVRFDIEVYLVYAVLFFVLHIVIKYVGYLAGIDKDGF